MNPTANSSMKQIRGKPPLVISPRRLRSRRVLPPLLEISASPSPPIEPPKPAIISSSASGSKMEIFSEDDQYQFFYPEYPALSLELCKLARKPAVLFERGPRYDEYAARRNERLMRRKKMGDEENIPVATPKRNNNKDLGVVLGSEMMTKRKSVMSKKKTENLRKSLPPLVDFSRVGAVRSSFSSALPNSAGVASNYNLRLRSSTKGSSFGSTPTVGIRNSVDGFSSTNRSCRTTRSRK
ncbi:hypothetical protein ZOSMA_109G00380 [Zostera marina]|uniref:Uncharacterized protein n=1 Tax=Zostera marina TaxID=29655 RepID=A0A0K9Q5V1_ZOSMR|nr:hypothetical protein ZOSMA_109G00380 [Zostera marina]